MSQHLLPDNPSFKRHADKLIKAWHKNGQDLWFLIHVEVQGYRDIYFAQRFYECNYRIRDKFQRAVTGLAIYTDRNRKYHYKAFTETFFGSEVSYKFRACSGFGSEAKESKFYFRRGKICSRMRAIRRKF